MNLSNVFIDKKIHDNLFHPVHILDLSKNFTPSAFIPFCSYGDNMEVVGEKIDRFPIPVCNKFVKTTLNGQVCYSIDINKINRERQFSMDSHKIGLKLLVDHNEARQTFEIEINDGVKNNNLSMNAKFISSNKENDIESLVYFGTLGI